MRTLFRPTRGRDGEAFFRTVLSLLTILLFCSNSIDDDLSFRWLWRLWPPTTLEFGLSFGSGSDVSNELTTDSTCSVLLHCSIGSELSTTDMSDTTPTSEYALPSSITFVSIEFSSEICLNMDCTDEINPSLDICALLRETILPLLLQIQRKYLCIVMLRSIEGVPCTSIVHTGSANRSHIECTSDRISGFTSRRTCSINRTERKATTSEYNSIHIRVREAFIAISFKSRSLASKAFTIASASTLSFFAFRLDLLGDSVVLVRELSPWQPVSVVPTLPGRGWRGLARL